MTEKIRECKFKAECKNSLLIGRFDTFMGKTGWVFTMECPLLESVSRAIIEEDQGLIDKYRLEKDRVWGLLADQVVGAEDPEVLEKLAKL